MIRDLAPGTVLGSWRIVRKLGQGGMGAVYEAHDPSHGQVALKLLLADEKELVLRFEREARAAQAVHHEHVVRTFGVAREQGRLVLALELLPGGTLSALVKREGPLPWREAARLGAKIARGLAAIHAAGFVHRDLKPENVLLDARGSPKITDFGLVRRVAGQTVSEGLTRAGDILGTYAFMAPEQAEGTAVDHRTDLYSFGATLYFLLAGAPPHVGSSFEIMKKLLLERPRSVSERGVEVPPSLERLLGRLLEKAPASRPESAASVAAELDAIGSGVARKRTLAPWLALGVVVPAAVALAFLAKGRPEPPPPPPPPPVAPPEPSPEERFRARYEPCLKSSGLVARVAGCGDPGHAGSVRTIALAGQGSDLVAVSGGDDELVRVWNPRTGTELSSFAAGGAVRSLAVSADGKLIAFGTRSQRAGVFFRQQGSLLWSKEDLGGEVVVAISPGDDEVLLANSPATKPSRLRRFRALDGTSSSEQPIAIAGSPWFIRYPNDGSRRAAVGLASGLVLLCDLAGATVAFSHKLHDRDATEGVFLAGERTLATVGNDGRLVLTDAETLATEERAERDPDGDFQLTGIALLPDGGLATAGACGNVHLWDARGNPVGQFRAHAGNVNAVAAVKDGGQTLIATAGDDGTVRFFDQAGTERGVDASGSHAHRGIVNSIAVSPDGGRLLTAAEDGSVKLWDAENVTVLASFENLGRGALTGAAFLGSGERFVSLARRGGFRTWKLDAENHRADPLEGREVATSHETSALAVSADGKRLVALETWQHGPELFENHDGRWGPAPLPRLQRGSAGAFSPDGLRVAFSNYQDQGGEAVAVVELPMGKLSATDDPEGVYMDHVAFSGSELVWVNHRGFVHCRGWSHKHAATPTGLAASDSRIAALFADARILILDASDGSLRATVSLEAAKDVPRCAAFDPGGSRLWVGTGRGALLRIDLAH